MLTFKSSVRGYARVIPRNCAQAHVCATSAKQGVLSEGPREESPGAGVFLAKSIFKKIFENYKTSQPSLYKSLHREGHYWSDHLYRFPKTRKN